MRDKKNWKLIVFGGLFHSIAWIVGFFLFAYVFSYSASSYAYGYLSGWWLALYVGYLTNIKFRSAYIAAFLYLILGIFSSVYNWVWFYKDFPNEISLDLFAILFIGMFVFVSPIFVNSVMRLIKQFLKKKYESPVC